MPHAAMLLDVTSILIEMDEAQSPDLLARAQGGDAQAYLALCQPLETRLLRHAMVLCGHGALAEELAEETLVEGWKCVWRYDGRCRFFTWLCAILLNRYRNVRRKRLPVPFSALSRSEGESAEQLLDQLVDSGTRPDVSAQEAERNALLRQSIQRLGHKHRQVLHLRFFAGESIEGIAAALHCSPGTVKSRLFHALERLRTFQEIASAKAEWDESGGLG